MPMPTCLLIWPCRPLAERALLAFAHDASQYRTRTLFRTLKQTWDGTVAMYPSSHGEANEPSLMPASTSFPPDPTTAEENVFPGLGGPEFVQE